MGPASGGKLVTQRVSKGRLVGSAKVAGFRGQVSAQSVSAKGPLAGSAKVAGFRGQVSAQSVSAKGPLAGSAKRGPASGGTSWRKVRRRALGGVGQKGADFRGYEVRKVRPG